VTLSGVPKYNTIRLEGLIQGQRITTLVDGEAIQKFIDATLVACRGLHTEDFRGFTIVVANGYDMFGYGSRPRRKANQPHSDIYILCS
jgi:hypothetical protein